MTISRRRFIAGGLGVLGYCLTRPEMFALAAQAASLSPRVVGKSKILVVVQLSGGNDGLNSVVPYGIGTYYQLRPNLGIHPSDVLALNGQIGFNPNMKGFADLYHSGKLALLQAVGYPHPNRSHFRSMEIWQTAEPDRIADRGWLGKYLDLANVDAQDGNALPAVNVDPILPKTLSATKVIVPSVNNVYDFKFKTDPKYAQDRNVQIATFNDIYESFNLKRANIDLLTRVGMDANQASDYLLKIVHSYKGVVSYPTHAFGEGMKFISQMICGGVNSKIYNISLGSFDTHANQARSQNALLKQLTDGLAAFQADLEAHHVDSDVITLVFTEFGRRVAENSGHGTDHGTAEPVYVIGSAIKGGIYGSHADLSQLDDGDLRYKIDFRGVYATILDRWMEADSRQVLGANFDHLGFV